MFLCVSVSWLLKKVCEIENTSNQQAIGKLWDGIPRSQKLFLKQTFGCRNINTEAIPSYICSSVWARNEPWPFFAGREIGLQRAMIDTKMIIAGCKYLSCILRLCILAAVLMTGFMVILTASETQVIRRSVKGIISHETCFFFTGEEFGFNVDFGSISAKYGEDRFCGLTAKEVEQTFELAASNSESTSFWHHFTAEYLLQFFVAMGYAMFFVCVTVFRVTTTVFKEESTDDQCTSFMQQIWNLLFLTMLSAYLAFPMGSVRMLPEPVDNVAMVRTPPDYAALQVYSLFFAVPCLCCLPIWTACREETGNQTKCMLCTSLIAAIPIVFFVLHGYYQMSILYLDLSFSVSVGFTFVVPGILVKVLLWLTALIESALFVLEQIAKCFKGKKMIEDQLGKGKNQAWKLACKEVDLFADFTILCPSLRSLPLCLTRWSTVH